MKISFTIGQPYPADLIRTARKVVWYDAPESALRDAKTFLAHLMVYGSPADIAVIDQHVRKDEFRKTLEDAPAGVFTRDAWERWHERLGIFPIPSLPRRRFPAGTLGPEPETFFGR